MRLLPVPSESESLFVRKYVEYGTGPCGTSFFFFLSFLLLSFLSFLSFLCLCLCLCLCFLCDGEDEEDDEEESLLPLVGGGDEGTEAGAGDVAGGEDGIGGVVAATGGDSEGTRGRDRECERE